MLKKVLRSMLSLAVIVGVSNLVVAQYGGGGGMGGRWYAGQPELQSSRQLQQ